MAGIKTFNPNIPYVFRYPEWKEGVFYPSGSVVAVEIIDSDVYYDFYAAIRDVKRTDLSPNTNASEWRLLHDAFQIDSESIAALGNFDSERIRLYESIDSEELARRAGDSDILVLLDSEYKARREQSAEIYAWANQKFDSEESLRKAIDSDLLKRIIDNDSDIRVLYARSDSDIFVNLYKSLDSEILKRFSDDSDIRTWITSAVHNYLATDSDYGGRITKVEDRLDSDYQEAKRNWTLTGAEFPWGPQPFVSNTDFFIAEGNLTNHNQGYLWLVDHDDQGGARTPTIYIIKDGVSIGSANGNLLSTTVNVGLAGDFARGTQILDGGGGADVNIYTNQATGIPQVTNANLFTVRERTRSKSAKVVRNNLEDAVRGTVTNIIDIDSDIFVLQDNFVSITSGNDSDHAVFYDAIKELDSEVKRLITREDSDNKALQHLQTSLDSEEHDRRAADSDLIVLFTKLVDSDVRLTLEHDSDLFRKTDSEEKARRNADSDIYNKYTSVTFRYVKEETTVANITGVASLNYNVGNTPDTIANFTGGWIWNTWNNFLTIVDSDGTVIYNAQHFDEPILVSDPANFIQYRRLNDTGVNANITSLGAPVTVDDIWNFRKEYISKSPSNAGKLTAIIDSDINLHEWDSDNTDTLVYLATWMADKDSELFTINDKQQFNSIKISATDSEQFGIQITTDYSKSRKHVDSDFIHNFKLIHHRINVIDSDRPNVVRYRNDSDIQVRGIFFNNDSEGYLHWNPVDFTLDLHVNDEVTLQLGQEQTIFVRNESGRDMPNGTVVRLDGVSGSEFVVNFASNDSELSSHSTLGVTTQFIGDNNGGFVTFVGKVRGLDTQTPGWTVGDALWLGTDGNMTNVKPVSPAHLVFVGYVERVHPHNGIIYVKTQNGYELEEIHDVLITNYDSDREAHNHNRVLMYDSDSKLWKNTRINVDYGEF